MELTRVSLQVHMDVIRAYAELTQDFNPIHLDREMAAAGPMEGVIAHGSLSICLLWQAVFASFGDRALGDGVDLDVRFLKPVREGETLCAGGRSLAGDPDRFEVWVRGDDDSDRVAGTLHLPALKR
jgi:3-hydroxybutyryl-CoA dehydratase